MCRVCRVCRVCSDRGCGVVVSRPLPRPIRDIGETEVISVELWGYIVPAAVGQPRVDSVRHLLRNSRVIIRVRIRIYRAKWL